MKSQTISDLAEALAAAALATVSGGPLAGGIALAGAGIKASQKAFMKNADTRDLTRRVKTAVTAWAEGTRDFTPGQVTSGLDWAAKAVASHGVSRRELVELHYDADAAAARVIAKARESAVESARGDDRRPWEVGEEDTRAAEYAARETYKALVARLQEQPESVFDAVWQARSEIDTVLAGLRGQVGDLRETLSGLATMDEVVAYLRVRIRDWDLPTWGTQPAAPSLLERSLRVVASDGSYDKGDAVGAGEALDGARMLVVLGGPGSGKSWLARRYAREAAQTALARLERGAWLDEVELPLFTTWDHWVRESEGSGLGTRASLVKAGLSSGPGNTDPGSQDVLDRLKRLFERETTKLLVIVDSLDEASVDARQGRVGELVRSTGERVVATSRPAAWETAFASYKTTSSGDQAPRVVAIEDLDARDVVAFVRAWFAHDPASGTALLETITYSPVHAEAAKVPLMLTFYCLITADPDNPSPQLPQFRREVYNRLVLLLLSGKWTKDRKEPPGGLDTDACVALLQGWAWSAVKDRVTPAGLGNWGEEFPQPSRVPADLEQAVGHVAPIAGEDPDGGKPVRRRFAHRTLLEHFVAEHIATLDTNQAAKVLLPHLWFDPDWEHTAPAAVAAHNKHHPGELMRALLEATTPRRDNSAFQIAYSEFDYFLLAVAEESDPNAWPQDMRTVLDGVRERLAYTLPDAVTRSAHWTTSNSAVINMVLRALPRAKRSDVVTLVGVLARLGPSDDERAQARRAVLDTLPRARQLDLSDLIGAVLRLRPVGDERAEARGAVLAALPGSGPWTVVGLVDVLVQLGASGDERAQARRAVLDALPGSGPWTVSGLVGALAQMGPSDDERVKALRAGLAALGRAERWVAPHLVGALMRMGLSDDERAQVLGALLDARPWSPPSTANHLFDALLQLAANDDEQAKARRAVLGALPGTDRLDVAELAGVMLQLGASDDEQAQARRAVLDALPGANSHYMGGMIRALLRLGAGDDERAQARRVALDALPGAKGLDAADLARVLVRLGASDDERAQAHRAVLDALPGEDWTVPHLVDELVQLVPGGNERARAGRAVLDALPRAHPIEVVGLLGALVRLGASDDEGAQGRRAALGALPGADSLYADGMIRALLQLGASDDERAEGRRTVLEALRRAHPSDVVRLVRSLLRLGAGDEEHDQARQAVRDALPRADPSTVEDLVRLLVQLGAGGDARVQARQALLAALPGCERTALSSLVRAVRELSSVEDWLAWLRHESQGQGVSVHQSELERP